ncbi:unnamed protein product [Rotaria sp. Silwood1]|nr:unnamed protein product [Rotaria sp. Silwood1]
MNKCIEGGRTSNMSASAIDILNPSFRPYLVILDGYERNIGFIRQAKDVNKEKNYQHIGILESNKLLKSSVSEQTNPENPSPASLEDRDIDNLIKFRNNIEESFDKIPKNLKAFSQSSKCLDCIDANLNNQKIFFITSGSVGKEIAPEIIQKYSSLKTTYVF